MYPLRLVNARVLIGDALEDSTLAIEGGVIAEADARGGSEWDLGNRLVLPGIVDLHGDAFERQIMPRPGVFFGDEIALAETDRQLVANGITTAFHALTWSWEPGLRSDSRARAFVDALDRLRPSLGCDARLHLRWETFALDAVTEIERWIAGGRIHLLAFNDHTPDMVAHARGDGAANRYAERAGLDRDAFDDLLARVWGRRGEVPDAVAQLAAAARRAHLPLASHDDESPAERAFYRGLGAASCEFPKTRATAAYARAGGDHVLMGAPNVVRGGSHLNLVSAESLVRDGLCDVLTSDYYYPALLHAAFRLARAEIVPFGAAWALVSAAPAAAAGLSDRGRIAAGLRADLAVVDDSVPGLPRVVATIVAGRIVYRDDADRRLAA